jgi:hypothetical protein
MIFAASKMNIRLEALLNVDTNLGIADVFAVLEANDWSGVEFEVSLVLRRRAGSVLRQRTSGERLDR